MLNPIEQFKRSILHLNRCLHHWYYRWKWFHRKGSKLLLKLQLLQKFDWLSTCLLEQMPKVNSFDWAWMTYHFLISLPFYFEKKYIWLHHLHLIDYPIWQFWDCSAEVFDPRKLEHFGLSRVSPSWSQFCIAGINVMCQCYVSFCYFQSVAFKPFMCKTWKWFILDTKSMDHVWHIYFLLFLPEYVSNMNHQFSLVIPGIIVCWSID